MSPPSAHSPNIAVPPFGILCAERLRVPGHTTPTERPDRPSPSIDSQAHGENATMTNPAIPMSELPSMMELRSNLIVRRP